MQGIAGFQTAERRLGAQGQPASIGATNVELGWPARASACRALGRMQGALEEEGEIDAARKGAHDAPHAQPALALSGTARAVNELVGVEADRV